MTPSRGERQDPTHPHAVSVAAAPSTPVPSANPNFVRRTRPTPAPATLAAALRAQDPAALGQTVSLIESAVLAHQHLAHEVLVLLTRDAPRAHPAVRVGVTGVPGAGKSTLIDRLGIQLVGAGRRLAVLAVDPSSDVSGGSILGDKTRMPRLAAHPRAFIRPSPSAGTLGGVARTTRQTIALLEAAGFDTILVETVGVGQSETAVARMTDVFLAVVIPGAGDELQGIKRGLLELVDIVAVNKADGDNAPRAARAAHEYAAALRIASRADDGSTPAVLTCSALTGEGLAELWNAVLARFQRLADGEVGTLMARRRHQDAHALEQLVDERLRRLIADRPAARRALENARAQITTGALPPDLAAQQVIDALIRALRSD